MVFSVGSSRGAALHDLRGSATMKTHQTEKYLTEKEMAAVIKISDKSLKNRRCAGKNHPPFIKLGSTVLYPESLAHKWLMEKVEHPLR